MKLISTLFLVSFLLAAPPAGAQNDVERVESMVRQSQFGVWRGLIQYFVRIGPEFTRRLLELKPGETWVDLGHGDGVALREYLVLSDDEFHAQVESADMPQETRDYLRAIHLPPLDRRGNVFGIGFHTPDRERNPELFARVEALDKKSWWPLNRPVPRYRDYSGRFIKDISDRELGAAFANAKIVTDFYGILNYETDFLPTFKRVLTAMPKESFLIGRFFTFVFNFGDESGTVPRGTMGWPDFELIHERRTRWFKSFRGAELTLEIRSHDDVLGWKRTEGPVKWAPIEQTKTHFLEHNVPPERVFHLLPDCEADL